MLGKAKLDIPASGEFGPIHNEGLSDELAMIFGRIAARTLSEEDGFVTVTLESGDVKVIGHNTITGLLTIGLLRKKRIFLLTCPIEAIE